MAHSLRNPLYTAVSLPSHIPTINTAQINYEWLREELSFHIGERRSLSCSARLQRQRRILILPRHRQINQRRRRKSHPIHGTITVLRRHVRTIVTRQTIRRRWIRRCIPTRVRLIVVVPLQTRA